MISPTKKIGSGTYGCIASRAGGGVTKVFTNSGGGLADRDKEFRTSTKLNNMYASYRDVLRRAGKFIPRYILQQGQIQDISLASAHDVVKHCVPELGGLDVGYIFSGDKKTYVAHLEINGEGEYLTARFTPTTRSTVQVHINVRERVKTKANYVGGDQYRFWTPLDPKIKVPRGNNITLHYVPCKEGDALPVIHMDDGGEALLQAYRSIPRPELKGRWVAIVMFQLMEVLAFLQWAGWAHLDLKPENVLWDKKNKSVRVIDWGFACRVEEVFPADKRLQFRQLHPGEHPNPPEIYYYNAAGYKERSSWNTSLMTYIGSVLPAELLDSLGTNGNFHQAYPRLQHDQPVPPVLRKLDVFQAGWTLARLVTEGPGRGKKGVMDGWQADLVRWMMCWNPSNRLEPVQVQWALREKFWIPHEALFSTGAIDVIMPSLTALEKKPLPRDGDVPAIRRFPVEIVTMKMSGGKVAVYADRWDPPTRVCKVISVAGGDDRLSKVARELVVMRYMAGWWPDFLDRSNPMIISDDDAHPYVKIQMTYVGASAFSIWAGGNASTKRSMPPGETFLQYAVDWAKSLHTMHRFGLVHNDVHPGNLCITERGEGKVCDFGKADCVHHGKGKKEYRWPIAGDGEPDKSMRDALKTLPPLGDYGSLTVSIIALLLGRNAWKKLVGVNVAECLHEWKTSYTKATNVVPEEIREHFKNVFKTKGKSKRLRSQIIKDLLNLTGGSSVTHIDLVNDFEGVHMHVSRLLDELA